MKSYSKYSLLLLLISLATGCSVFSNPDDITHLENKTDEIIVSQADKRAIFIFKETTNKKPSYHVCPEPSPDVKADIDTTIKALLDASVKTPANLSANAKTELDATRKIITSALLQRSQGLQVMRDLLFQACLAHERNSLTPAQYADFLTRTIPNLTSGLIAMEMMTKIDKENPILHGEDLKIFLKSFLNLTTE